MLESKIEEPIPGGVWTWRRFQLGSLLILGALLPFLIGAAITPELLRLNLYTNSLIYSTIAIVLSYYFLNSLVTFPGTRVDYYILPVYSSTFTAIFAVLLLTRLEYSRSIVLAGYAIAVTWQYAISFKLKRRQRLAFGVVPFGRVGTLYDIPSIRWVVLQSPVVPRRCQAVVADFGYDLDPEWEGFLADAALRGVSVLHYKQLREAMTGQVQIEHLSENSQGTLIPNKSFLTIKTAIDCVTAAVALALLVPAFLVIGALVKASSPGAVFFRQQRVGYRGRLFQVWKFRTMYEPGTGPAERESVDQRESAKTQDDDPRVTNIGRFLRRTRLDELPQLINVVRAEMSWIGPRPEAEVLSRWYQAEIPFYRYRHIVRPGISGWAQVNQGHVAELSDVLHKLNYDFFYISKFSFWLDILIVLRTIKTIATGFGAR